MTDKTKKKKADPKAENSARIRREAGVLIALSALIPAVAALVTALTEARRKR